MDRKQFLKRTLSLAAGVGGMSSGTSVRALSRTAGAPKGAGVPLTILFTGDTHARYAPFPDTAGPLAGLGGLERRAAYIEAVRAEGRAVLLMDTGDFLDSRTGAMEPFGAADVLGWMERLGYDAAVPGNHDLAVLMGQDRLPDTPFPLVLSNYRYKDKASALQQRLDHYTVRQIGGIKVGLFGLGPELRPLAAPGSAWGEGLAHRSPRYLAESMVRRLRRIEGCDLVICLSHLGYAPGDWRARQRGTGFGSGGEGSGPASEAGHGTGILQEDLALFQDPPADARRTWSHTARQREQAQSQGREAPVRYDLELARRVGGIDLILGGHTHTFMRRPTVVGSPDGSTTTIAHPGYGGAVIGRVDVELSRAKGQMQREFVSAELKELS